MTCGYCGFRNSEDEHRCRRCGRKPGDSLGQYAATSTTGALAAAPQMVAEPALAVESAPNLSQAVQGALFVPKTASNVIPFESYAGSRVETRPRPQAEPGRKAVSKPAVKRSRAPEMQTSLEFLPPAPAAPRTLGTTVEAVISCEAPVATPLHRAVAAALDWSMVLIGYGLFLAAFLLAGGAFVFTKTNVMLFGGALPLVAFTYGVFWTVAGTETPGMRWAELQLTTFDGSAPEYRQRILRFAGSCLSFCTLIGLLWSLADEESLNWQDHISRTFPTPLGSEMHVFNRR